MFHLSLDALAEEGYIYSTYDVSGAGHDLYIKPEDKQAFLEEYTQRFREMVEKSLEEVETDWE